MADRTRTITLKVDDAFSQQLARYVAQIGQANTTTQNFGSKGSQSLMQIVKNIRDLGLAGMAIKGTFDALAGTISEFAEIGTAARRNEGALRALTGSSAEYEAQVQAIIRATRQTVTESEAASYAYSLQRFGLADTSEEMERFISTITLVAAANPALGGTAEAINQIQLTMSNMSFMRLDQLGVSAGEVRQRISELRQETKGLSQEDAFAQAVMEQLEEQANTLGDSFLEIGGAQERMKARFRGFKEWMGIEVSEALDTAFIHAENLYNVLVKLDGLGGTFDWSLGIIQASVDYASSGGQSRNLLEQATIATAGAGRQVGPQANPYMPWSGFAQQDYSGMVAPTVPEWMVARYTQGPYTSMEAINSYIEGIQNPQANIRGFLDWDSSVQTRRRAQLGDQGLPTLPTVIPSGTGMTGPASAASAASAMEAQTRSMDLFSTAPEMAMTGWDALGSTATENIEKAIASTEGLSGALRRINEDAQDFASLTEKFGIDPDQVDVDILNEVQQAMRDVGVETETAADAMDIYKLMTGQATGSSELFQGQLERLTQELADGNLKAEDYARKVQELGEMDMSGIDLAVSELIDAGDIEGAQELIDQVSQMDFTQLQTFMENLAAPEDEEANVFTSLMEDAATMETEFGSTTMRMTETAAEAWGTINSEGSAEFGDMRSQIIAELDEVEQKIIAMKNVSFSIAVNTTLDGETVTAPTSSRSRTPLPEFHEGGYTGPGTGEFLAKLKRNEVVIPLDQMQSVSSTAGTSSVNFPNATFIFQGVEDPRAFYDKIEAEGKRRGHAMAVPAMRAGGPK